MLAPTPLTTDGVPAETTTSPVEVKRSAEHWRLRTSIVGVVLADKDIAEKEVNFIYHIGKLLGLSVKEVSQIFASQVQRNYVPSLDAIS